MKKLLGLLSVLTITSNTTLANILSSSLLAKLENYNKTYSNNNKYKINQNEDLKYVLLDRDLGNIYIGNKLQPSADEIKIELIKEKRNFNLNTRHIIISNITSTDALITGDNQLYTGQEEIIFNIVNFKKMNQLNKKIFSWSIDKNQNIYVGTSEGVYKTKGTDSFTLMLGISGTISSLAVDKDDNVYAGTNTSFYKSNGTEPFKKINETYSSKITSLVVNSNNNIYIGTSNGDVFFYNYKRNNLKYMMGINEMVYTLAVDKDDNVYAGTMHHNGDYGTIYKCAQGSFSFFEIQGAGSIGPILSLAISNNGTIYVGSIKGVYKLTDGFTFKQIFKTSGPEIVENVKIDRKNNLYVQTFDFLNKTGKIFKYSTDQTEFQKMTSTTTKLIRKLLIDKDDNVYTMESDINLGIIFKSENVLNNNPTGNFNINYDYNKNAWASWSSSLTFNDDKTYTIIKYDDYAWSWDDFIKNNKYSILYLKGLNAKACSMETFGCTAENYSELKHFKNDLIFDLKKISENNDKNKPYWVTLYKVYDHVASAYEVKCKACLGFFIDKRKKQLKVRFKSENYLWSAGAYNRNLTIKNNLDSFYFIPNEDFM